LKTVQGSLEQKNTKTPQLSREESMDIDEFSPNQKRRRTSTKITNRPLRSSSHNQDATDTDMETVSINGDSKDDDFKPSHGPSQNRKEKGASRSTGT
jgi:cytochrome c